LGVERKVSQPRQKSLDEHGLHLRPSINYLVQHFGLSLGSTNVDNFLLKKVEHKFLLKKVEHNFLLKKVELWASPQLSLAGRTMIVNNIFLSSL
jgi:hypothetical protein